MYCSWAKTNNISFLKIYLEKDISLAWTAVISRGKNTLIQRNASTMLWDNMDHSITKKT